MDFELHVVKGRSAAPALKLADGVNTVGRHDDCTVRIKSKQVSRRHCELFEKKGTLIVKDLGSANGTYVNGKRVQGQQVLEPGDELTIGGVKLRIAKVGVAPPTRPVAPPKTSDTAEAEVVASSSDEEEFEIDFDDEPATADAALNGDEIEIDLDDDLAPLDPEPSTAKPAKEKPAEPKKSPPSPEPAAAKAAEGADEAVADFLLDIKLDDED